MGSTLDVKGGARKEKRKLRNLVRRKALKESRKSKLATEHPLPDAPGPSADGSTKKKKKNRGKKKMFLKLEAKAQEMGVPVENLIEKKEDSMLKRLEGGRFRYLNEKLYTMTGEEAKQMFEEDPEAFDQYHSGYRDQAKRWPLNPVNVIIQQLRTKADLVIADMGCGDAKIAEVLGAHNTVHSFDLVAKKPGVVACEMSHVPLEKDTCDVVVFCLSLMGTNVNEYLREAHRILKMGGDLRIAEVCSRFDNVRAFMRAVSHMGFEFKTSKTMQDYFVLFHFKKAGKVEHKRPSGLTLKPCLYKKR
uniref:Ribosomal RNA-processing protein 8 n=1 Tax=Steinernema glaseri TaxID=37863 RepID=A0A1I7XYF6_9BILA